MSISEKHIQKAENMVNCYKRIWRIVFNKYRSTKAKITGGRKMWAYEGCFG